MSRPRIRIQDRAAPGEIIEIRTLIDHPMVTSLSSPQPRDMLATLEARMNGETFFVYEFDNGTSANPYHVFFAKVEETSDFEFVWTHENGETFTAQARVTVS